MVVSIVTICRVRRHGCLLCQCWLVCSSFSSSLDSSYSSYHTWAAKAAKQLLLFSLILINDSNHWMGVVWFLNMRPEVFRISEFQGTYIAGSSSLTHLHLTHPTLPLPTLLWSFSTSKRFASQICLEKLPGSRCWETDDFRFLSFLNSVISREPSVLPGCGWSQSPNHPILRRCRHCGCQRILDHANVQPSTSKPDSSNPEG